MGNLVGSLKKFLANKNTVTILAVIAGVIVLWAFYNYRVNQAISTIKVPYAISQIDTGKKIDVENIDYKEFESKLCAIVEKKLGENWLPCSIEYTFKPLKRMTNSKLDISYYQKKDTKEYEEGQINSEEAQKLRLKKM